MHKLALTAPIKAIIGLGNPGLRYYYHRHSIGFRVLDQLARQYGARWRERDTMAYTDVIIGGHTLMLVKPLTYMNASGRVMPYLTKKGFGAENILVVHDELELPFGTIAAKVGGSHKGHNGLKSIIAALGPEFVRVRFGIGRPEDREQVPAYVLQNFEYPAAQVEQRIDEAVNLLENLVITSYESGV